MNIALTRLGNQHLVGKPFGSVVEVVDWLGAVQSQDYGAAKWGLAQRVEAVVDAEIDRLFDGGEILRTHILRPTWHFVLPKDIRWMLALTAPRVLSVSAYYYRKCNLSEPFIVQTNDLIAKAVAGKNYQTRNELGVMLRQNGIDFDALRLTYIVMCAELDAVICSGPRRGKQFTYALFDERTPSSSAKTREEALAELARRYFQSHGPASPHDFSNWSGLSVSDARHAVNLLADGLDEIKVDGKPFYFMPASEPVEPSPPIFHLLPNYDEHVIAYKDYASSFDPDVYAKIDSSEEFLYAHILTKNGKIVGGWRRTVAKKKVQIEIMPIIDLSERDRVGIRLAADRYGSFLGVAAEVTYP